MISHQLRGVCTVYGIYVHKLSQAEVFCRTASTLTYLFCNSLYTEWDALFVFQLFLSIELVFCSGHKVRTYKEYHSVCPSSELGLPPTPHPQASVPPPPVSGGRGTLAERERGWESPNSDEGHTLWYSLYVRTLWFRVSSWMCFSCIPPMSFFFHGSH